MSINRDQASEAITHVLWYIANYREDAIEALFGKAVKSYKKEWEDADVVYFWFKLDKNNRELLIDLALKQYGETV